MSTQTPYRENFSCNRIEKAVQISATKVTLFEGPVAVDSQLTHYSCSGQLTCGVLLGSETCPYSSKP